MSAPDLTHWKHSLKTRASGTIRQVFDPLRRKWVAMTPEEVVRQLTIAYLADVTGCPLSRMSAERRITINDMERRYDLVLFDKAARPWLLVECKAPGIPIDQKTIDQAARYNMALRVPYVLITNGLHVLCCAVNAEEGTWTAITTLPRME